MRRIVLPRRAVKYLRCMPRDRQSLIYERMASILGNTPGQGSDMLVLERLHHNSCHPSSPDLCYPREC